MTQKLFCLCVALLFAFVTLNVASAEEVQAGAADCPCVKVAPCFACAGPCKFNSCCPPVNYRVGLFGVVRPVVYAPVYRPVYYPPRFVRAPYCYPTPVCW